MHAISGDIETENYHTDGDFIYYGPGLKSAINKNLVSQIQFITLEQLEKEQRVFLEVSRVTKDFDHALEKKHRKFRKRWNIIFALMIASIIAAMIFAIKSLH